MGLKEMNVPFAPSKFSYFFFSSFPKDDRRRRWLASAKSQHGFSFHKSQPLIMTHATHAQTTRHRSNGQCAAAVSVNGFVYSTQPEMTTQTSSDERRATSSIALKMEGNETAAAPVCVLKAYEIVVVVHHNHGIPSFMINPCSITIEMMKRDQGLFCRLLLLPLLFRSIKFLTRICPPSIHPHTHTHTCATSADVFVRNETCFAICIINILCIAGSQLT